VRHTHPVTLKAVTLVLCSSCLEGCKGHPNTYPERCDTEGCAIFGARRVYEGLHSAVLVPPDPCA
jgi:hypothetical protein